MTANPYTVVWPEGWKPTKVFLLPVRKPPRDPDFRLPAPLCVWCGRAVESKRNARWHHECVDVYRIAKFQADAIKHVWARDKGICAQCGMDAHKWGPEREVRNPLLGYWRADHIVPLWAVDKTATDAFRYWTLENLQTLCKWCHDKKTSAEAGERARTRRGI